MDSVTSSSLEEHLKTNKKIVLKFGAEWCGGCKAIKPYLAKLQELYPQVVFLEVDADVEADLVTKYNVKNLPTLVGFSNGVKVDTLTGSGLGMKVLKEFVMKI